MVASAQEYQEEVKIMKEPMVETDSKFDFYYHVRAPELIEKYLKELGLDITFGGKFSEKSQPSHSWGDYQNPSVYFYGFYGRYGHETGLPIAILNHDGVLRFLIPNNHGVLEVHDLKEKSQEKDCVDPSTIDDRANQY